MYPQEVVLYASKHGHTAIVAEAAPMLLKLPLEDVVVLLPPNLVVPWVSIPFSWASWTSNLISRVQVLYHSAWNAVLHQARSFHVDLEGLRKGVTMKTKTPAFVEPIYSGAFQINPVTNRKEVGETCACKVDETVCTVLKRLDNIECLQNLTEVFRSESACAHIRVHLGVWQLKIGREIATIKPSSTYL
jgi:hypothetical protein